MWLVKGRVSVILGMGTFGVFGAVDSRFHGNDGLGASPACAGMTGEGVTCAGGMGAGGRALGPRFRGGDELGRGWRVWGDARVRQADDVLHSGHRLAVKFHPHPPIESGAGSSTVTQGEGISGFLGPWWGLRGGSWLDAVSMNHPGRMRLVFCLGIIYLCPFSLTPKGR